MWSDRAGALFDDVIDIVIRGGRKVERDYDIDLVDRTDIPGEVDEIGHALFWGSGTLLIAWLARRRLPVIMSALLVGCVSLIFEIGQPLLSQTRAIEPSDAVANWVGVGLGTVAATAAVWVWRHYGAKEI